MNCTTTFRIRKRCAGMTMSEMLVAVGISGMVVIAVAMVLFHSGRSFVAMVNYVDLDNKSRKALDRMSQEIREANSLSSFSTTNLPSGQTVTNGLVFAGTETSGTAYTLNYSYNPGTKELTRTKVESGLTNSEVLLTGCSYLTFGLFQRNSPTNSFDQFDLETGNNCKVVQLYWVCSRSIFGQAVNTESIQSAKVVIRKG